MNARRGFLAFVGGALVSGSITRATAGTAPTLILPPAAAAAPSWPLLMAERSDMEAFLRVSLHMPRDLYRDWLEAGLRQARPFEAGYDQAAEERRIRRAVRAHGSLIDAVRAGAL